MTFFSSDFLLIVESLKTMRRHPRMRQKPISFAVAATINTLVPNRNLLIFELKTFLSKINQEIFEIITKAERITNRKTLKKEQGLKFFPTLILSPSFAINAIAHSLQVKNFQKANLLEKQAFKV